MKTRNGFVSNSSSSSFIIKKKFVTGEQIEAIKNHIEYANAHNWIENTLDEDGDFEAEGCGYGKPHDADTVNLMMRGTLAKLMIPLKVILT